MWRGFSVCGICFPQIYYMQTNGVCFCRVCSCGPAVKHLRGSGFMKARIKCVDPSVSENRLD